jgi:hypothetical protein
MDTRTGIIAKVALTSVLALAAVWSFGLALVAAPNLGTFSRFWAVTLAIAATFFAISIYQCWRRPNGWRLALVACVVAAAIWGHFQFTAWYLPPPFGYGVP